MADWWAHWWPVAIPALVLIIGAVFAFLWLDDDDEGDR